MVKITIVLLYISVSLKGGVGWGGILYPYVSLVFHGPFGTLLRHFGSVFFFSYFAGKLREVQRQVSDWLFRACVSDTY